MTEVRDRNTKVNTQASLRADHFFLKEVTSKLVKITQRREEKLELGILSLCVYGDVCACKELRGSRAELIIFISIHSSLSLSSSSFPSLKYTIYPQKHTHICTQTNP